MKDKRSKLIALFLSMKEEKLLNFRGTSCCQMVCTIFSRLSRQIWYSLLMPENIHGKLKRARIKAASMLISKLSVLNGVISLNQIFNSQGKKAINTNQETNFSFSEYNPGQFHCKIIHFSRHTRL